MTPEQRAGLFNKLTLREARVDHKVLVTTMLDHRTLAKRDLRHFTKTGSVKRRLSFDHSLVSCITLR